jgi:hypothetical protein
MAFLGDQLAADEKNALPGNASRINDGLLFD